MATDAQTHFFVGAAIGVRDVSTLYVLYGITN
jgi:hypothetical protein